MGLGCSQWKLLALASGSLAPHPSPTHTPGLSGGSPVWGASKHLAILPEGPIQVVLMLDPPTCPWEHSLYVRAVGLGPVLSSQNCFPASILLGFLSTP